MGFALPSGVINTDSAYFYADSTFKFGPLVKNLSDQTLIVVDYSLFTPTHVVDGFMFTLDVTSNPALVVAYPALNSTKSVLTFLVSGGIAGQSYALSINTVLAINTRTDVLTINIPSSGGECERINPVPELYTQLPLGDPTQGYVNTGVRYFWGRVPPTNPNVMDQWYSPDTQVLSEYVTDGKVYSWQSLIDTGLAGEAPLPQDTQTLYYVSVQGQTIFPLSAADIYGNSAFLTNDMAMTVTKGGLRLVPDNGTGVGGYTVDVINNAIILLWPAGDGEILVADIYDAIPIGTGPQGPPGPTGPQGPVGPTGPQGPVGGVGNWWVGLPTTLPPLSGVLWNNGGVICVS